MPRLFARRGKMPPTARGARRSASSHPLCASGSDHQRTVLDREPDPAEPRALREPTPVDHPLHPRHRRTPIDEYATANAAQFAITRATLQEARSAAGGKLQVRCCRSVAPVGCGCERRVLSSESVATARAKCPASGMRQNPFCDGRRKIRNFAGRDGGFGIVRN